MEEKQPHHPETVARRVALAATKQKTGSCRQFRLAGCHYRVEMENI